MKTVYKYVLLAIAFGLPLGWVARDIATGVSDSVATEIVEPEGPRAKNVVVGQLVKLKMEGDDVEWTRLHKDRDLQPGNEEEVLAYGEKDQKCVLSFRDSGVHYVFGAAVRDGAVEIQRFDFNVSTSTVGPGPGPNPLAARIRSWRPGPKVEALKIADVFDRVAAETEKSLNASILVTPQSILSATTSSMRAAVSDAGRWATFFGGLEDYLKSESDNGSLRTQRDYVRVWRELANALREYSR